MRAATLGLWGSAEFGGAPKGFGLDSQFVVCFGGFCLLLLAFRV